MSKTLFSRTALTISSLLFIFVLLASSVIFYYIMTPMARQSASHLAALVSLSAQTWVELPPDTRQDFELELQNQHGIMLYSLNSNQVPDYNPISASTPFLSYFKEEVQLHLGSNVTVLEEFKPEFWIWIKIPIASQTLYVGFSHDIIGPNPPMVFFILIIVGAILVVISSLFFASYLVGPINNLLRATKQLGKGTSPEPINEMGPQELIQLTRSFNTMNTKIQELLQNRTVLLAGISHDLRTPIARIHLALEMLNQQQDQDQDLINGISHDLYDMNELIQRTLDFSKGLDLNNQEFTSIDIHHYIKNYIQSHPYSSLITCESKLTHKNCFVSLSTGVLDRVLNNLLENAIRYSHKQIIKVEIKESVGYCCIHILDSGSGIPENQLNAVFQPFFRLESSRNSETGGSGLGLAIVSQLCKAHGWEIQLKNRRNQGIEVILTLSSVKFTSEVLN